MSAATLEKGSTEELTATADKWIARWSAYPASDKYAADRLHRWIELRNMLTDCAKAGL